jgi:orotate phosphoribosyltransferase
MSWLKQKEFNQFLIDKNVIGFFEAPVTLKSGRNSNWYINFRTIAEDAKRLDVLTDFVVDFVAYSVASAQLSESPLCLYGVPEGATKAAIIAQMKWAKSSSNFCEDSHPVPMGRAKPKEHGMAKDKLFVGAPRGATLVLEDVTTTGGSLVTALKALEEAQIPVIGAIGFANRMERRDDGKSVSEAIAGMSSGSKSLTYLFMSSALELLPLAKLKLEPKAEVLLAIEREFEEWGVEKIRF